MGGEGWDGWKRRRKRRVEGGTEEEIGCSWGWGSRRGDGRSDDE